MKYLVWAKVNIIHPERTGLHFKTRTICFNIPSADQITALTKTLPQLL